MRDKEDKLLKTLFNENKEWSFTELVERTGISKPQLTQHLKKLQEKGIVNKHKETGEHPRYILQNNETVKERKRIYAQEKISPLSEKLAKSQAQVAIIFGSMSRWDWYEDSDIDVFVYGEGVKLEELEETLGRTIDLHHAKDKEELRRMKHLLPHILQGMFVKGDIEKLGVKIDV